MAAEGCLFSKIILLLIRLKVERREKSGLQLQEMKRSAFIIKKIWKSWSRWGVS